MPSRPGSARSLREARERRGLSLEEIATTTKISVSALDALERYDASSLPGGIFTRAFVRSYATEVGVDPEAALHEFLSRCPEEDPVEIFGPGDSEASGLFGRRPGSPAIRLRLALLAVPLVALVIFVGVRACDESTSAVTSDGSLGVPPAVDAEPLAPASPVAREETPPVPEPVVRSVPLRMEIHPSGDCWVSAVVDGEAVLARLMRAGERQVLEAAEQIVLNVGDASVFSFTLNEEAGRLLGGSGQVVTETITTRNYRSYQVR